jgi:hypothetical protein
MSSHDPYSRPKIHEDVLSDLSVKAQQNVENVPKKVVRDMSVEKKIEIVLGALEEDDDDDDDIDAEYEHIE